MADVTHSFKLEPPFTLVEVTSSHGLRLHDYDLTTNHIRKDVTEYLGSQGVRADKQPPLGLGAGPREVIDTFQAWMVNHQLFVSLLKNLPPVWKLGSFGRKTFRRYLQKSAEREFRTGRFITITLIAHVQPCVDPNVQRDDLISALRELSELIPYLDEELKGLHRALEFRYDLKIRPAYKKAGIQVNNYRDESYTLSRIIRSAVSELKEYDSVSYTLHRKFILRYKTYACYRNALFQY